MKTKLLLISVLTLGISLSIIFLWQSTSVKPAPDVTFKTIYGEKIKLSSLLGQPVIISFWATDCASCIKEIPHLIELYKQFNPQGLEIIAVAMYYDPPNHVVDMTKATKIPYDVALDLKAEHAFAFGRVKLTPTTFLISPKGNIIMHQTGEFDFSKMKQQLKFLIQG